MRFVEFDPGRVRLGPEARLCSDGEEEGPAAGPPPVAEEVLAAVKDDSTSASSAFNRRILAVVDSSGRTYDSEPELSESLSSEYECRGGNLGTAMS